MKTTFVRPRIKVPPTKTNKNIDLISISCLIIILVSSCWLYSIAPDKVPMHFSIEGKVDRYDDKVMLFLLPIIALALFFGLHFISNKPYLFNYAQELNEKNFLKAYKTASTTLYILKLMVMLLFVGIQYLTYAAMNDNSLTLSKWFLIFPISMVIVTPILLATKSFQVKKKNETT